MSWPHRELTYGAPRRSKPLICPICWSYGHGPWHCQEDHISDGRPVYCVWDGRRSTIMTKGTGLAICIWYNIAFSLPRCDGKQHKDVFHLCSLCGAEDHQARSERCMHASSTSATASSSFREEARGQPASRGSHTADRQEAPLNPAPATLKSTGSLQSGLSRLLDEKYVPAGVPAITPGAVARISIGGLVSFPPTPFAELEAALATERQRTSEALARVEVAEAQVLAARQRTTAAQQAEAQHRWSITPLHQECGDLNRGRVLLQKYRELDARADARELDEAFARAQKAEDHLSDAQRDAEARAKKAEGAASAAEHCVDAERRAFDAEARATAAEARAQAAELALARERFVFAQVERESRQLTLLPGLLDVMNVVARPHAPELPRPPRT
jgi:hypothetical protein